MNVQKGEGFLPASGTCQNAYTLLLQCGLNEECDRTAAPPPDPMPRPIRMKPSQFFPKRQREREDRLYMAFHGLVIPSLWDMGPVLL